MTVLLSFLKNHVTVSSPLFRPVGTLHRKNSWKVLRIGLVNELRASYGMIANQNVPAYSFIPTMAVNNKYNGWISNGNYVTAITSIPSLVSRNFTWEKVGTLDIGIDFSMFSNRFTGTFDWYQRNTNGMLAPACTACCRCGCLLYQNTADKAHVAWN